MDTLARGLVNAAALIESGELSKRVVERYAGWEGILGRRILNGEMDFGTLAGHIHTTNPDLSPTSGRQELLENVVSRFVR